MNDQAMERRVAGDEQSGNQTVRVYINEQGLSVANGLSVLEALRVFDTHIAGEVEKGESRIVDSRGLDISANAIVSGGTILRVLPVRLKASSDTKADAENES